MITIIWLSHNLFVDKELELLQELPKCDTDTWRANAVGKMVPIDLLDAMVTTNQFAENTISGKCSKVKHRHKN